MRIFLFLLLALLFPALTHAQKRKKDQGPNELEVRQALVVEAQAAFTSGDLATAETKYTKALRLWDDRADRYQRALVRVARGDSAGWCADLSTFRGNDELQKNLYRTHCRQMDSVAFAASGLPASRFPGMTNVTRWTYRLEGHEVLKLYNSENVHRVTLAVSGTDTLFSFCDTLPSYPGGETEMYRFIGANTKYPGVALDNDRSGVVYVRFKVGPDGAIQQAEVFRGAYHALDEEALRVVRSMPAWVPGRWQGKPITAFYSLPFRFTLK